MKRLLLLLLACHGLQASVLAAPVQSVALLDLKRYLGTWYEVASYPMFFQRMCVADTTAEYGLLEDGRVSVRNRCRKEDGSFSEVTGKAGVVAGTGNAQLKVSFFWPFSAPYWVIGLDPDYRWAVVGNPNRDYLWILSRTPQLPPADWAAARAIAQQQGFDLERLKLTRQAP
ncbi:lipocalin family protein [Chitinimonas sp. BJYL2]|uniref:lipocalin family protein n=1 Tax=Chitinimonas sp. BJYL2 TaxID=2976696 RepID=UPI0022B48D3E|nr:lipocalin family protein [Chitinimonas sp. BJYL2]